MTKAVLGVIGGSGIYDLPGLTDIREERVATPWGEPSDALRFGRIGATPKSIGVFNSNLRPGEHTSAAYEGESCWITELRIPPGGTLDTFYTDAGAQWLGYCWVGIDALPGLSNLGLEVIFKDDFGVEGLATSTITAFR